jgi:hypothetical protein
VKRSQSKCSYSLDHPRIKPNTISLPFSFFGEALCLSKVSTTNTPQKKKKISEKTDNANKRKCPRN